MRNGIVHRKSNVTMTDCNFTYLLILLKYHIEICHLGKDKMLVIIALQCVIGFQTPRISVYAI